MADTKTKQTNASVTAYLDAVTPEEKRRDSYELMEMMKEMTGEEPKMWGPSIVGFGKYHYRYESGHEGDACIAGFSPRKSALTVYLMPGFADKEDLLARLGKHTTSVSCLYIKRLNDVDRDVLRELIVRSIADLRKLYPPTSP